MNPKSFLFTTLFIGLSCFSPAQNTRKILLIGEFSKDRSNEQQQLLIGLHFSDGLLEKRDTIYTGPTFKKKKGDFHPYFRLEFGNCILKGRYFVTFGGTVIDLRTRRMLKEDDGNFEREKGDTLFFFTENLFRGTYHTYLEVPSGKISKKYQPNNFGHKEKVDWAPGGESATYVDYSHLPYRIFLKSDTVKELIVPDAGHGTPLSVHASSLPAVPIRWLDSTRFVYIRFEGSTIRGYSGRIFLYNIQFRSDRAIGSIGNVDPGIVNARIFKDPANGLLLDIGEKYLQINPDSAKINEITRFRLDFGFSYDLREDTTWKQKIYYHDSLINDIHFLRSSAIEGYLALALRDKGAYTSAKKISIWNRFTRTWQIIPEPNLIDIFGWIEN